jgi:diguanylate cyclase (GGDEF)-like protein
MVLPGCDRDDALKIAERIRERLAAEPARHDGDSIPLSASIGVSVCSPGAAPPDVSDLLHSADKALYLAKRTGRNRVEMNAAG